MLWLFSSVCLGVAAPLTCPTGAAAKSQTTAEAREEWCEALDGRRQGPRRAYYLNGQPWFVGEYDQGRRAGAWTFWFPNGAVMATAVYREDKADGPMNRFKDTGVKEMTGVCKTGVEDGRWTRYWPNGKEELVVTFANGAPLPSIQYFSRRGGPIDQTRWLAERAPGVSPGSDRYAKLLADHQPAAIFRECRN